MKMTTEREPSGSIVRIPAKWYFLASLCIAALIGISTWSSPASPYILGLEVFITIIALFVFGGSIRYQIDKNTITYGAAIVIIATFLPIWWPGSSLHEEIARIGGTAIWDVVRHDLLTIHGLERLVHVDTMFFILGLTFFVGVISQTRLLEMIGMRILRIFEGRVFYTILAIVGLVSLASGILDGVSMVGLLIRIMVIILVMAKVPDRGIEFMVLLSVILTTVCGMWLAYGEPPNLIMKANLGLTDSFFLIYAAPMAVAAFIICAIFAYRWLRGINIPLDELDILEENMDNVRFLQAARQGEVKEMEDLLVEYHERLGDRAEHVKALYHQGHHPISSMIRAGAEHETIHAFIEEYLGKEFVEPVFSYYGRRLKREMPEEKNHEMVYAGVIKHLLENTSVQKNASQTWAKIAFIPFIGLLFWHARNHDVPLFLSSFAGFAVALLGIMAHPKMTRLALHEAAHEYKEYLFLFPLFLSITMLTAAGFFDHMKEAVEYGVTHIGYAHVAVIQFVGAGLLSAILDNNVVADFASRAIIGSQRLFIFSAAQISGYATGGTLTHIGSAQSVVAFAFITRYIRPNFTPLDWIKAIWKPVAAISIAMIVIIYIIALSPSFF